MLRFFRAMAPRRLRDAPVRFRLRACLNRCRALAVCRRCNCMQILRGNHVPSRPRTRMLCLVSLRMAGAGSCPRRQCNHRYAATCGSWAQGAVCTCRSYCHRTVARWRAHHCTQRASFLSNALTLWNPGYAEGCNTRERPPGRLCVCKVCKVR